MNQNLHGLEGMLNRNLTIFQNNEQLDVITTPLKKMSGWPKYSTILKKDNETIGVVFYHLDKDSNSTSFSGMEVISKHRSQGFANMLMEVYFSICEINNVQNFITKRQRKPLTAYILTAHGYEPNNRALKKQSYIYEKKNSFIRISFEDKNYGEKFEKTRIFKNQGYQIVDSPEEKPIATIQVPSGYKLTNHGILLKKREENKQLFKFE